MSWTSFDSSSGQLVPIRLWRREVSPEAMRLLHRLACQPYVVGHVASMADCHAAEGVAVGTVFATESAVVPGSLGSDLGCGMAAIPLELAVELRDRRTLHRCLESLAAVIPTGNATHRRDAGPPIPLQLPEELSTRSLERARNRLMPRQLGTLGGGNHFLELARGMDESVWLLVHTGSRGVGGAIGAHHARASPSGGADRLSALDAHSDAGVAFLNDASWATEFARVNRAVIAQRAVQALSEVLNGEVRAGTIIDRPHNFVARERWDGKELYVHRKGAAAIPPGEPGLVPGSMGTASYLVEGLGSDQSFGSCSHGAGRVMTRGEARRSISSAALAAAMRRIVWPEHLARSLVEEAPAVYRDIQDVLDDQRDLVRRVLRLEPILVLKG